MGTPINGNRGGVSIYETKTQKPLIMAQYRVIYKSEIISQPGIIRADGFSSIYLQNQGAKNATLNNNISLDANSPARIFNNEPEQIIGTDFSVSFQAGAGTQKILVIKSYFEKI